MESSDGMDLSESLDRMLKLGNMNQQQQEQPQQQPPLQQLAALDLSRGAYCEI